MQTGQRKTNRALTLGDGKVTSAKGKLSKSDKDETPFLTVSMIESPSLLIAVESSSSSLTFDNDGLLLELLLLVIVKEFDGGLKKIKLQISTTL